MSLLHSTYTSPKHTSNIASSASFSSRPRYHRSITNIVMAGVVFPDAFLTCEVPPHPPRGRTYHDNASVPEVSGPNASEPQASKPHGPVHLSHLADALAYSPSTETAYLCKGGMRHFRDSPPRPSQMTEENMKRRGSKKEVKQPGYCGYIGTQMLFSHLLHDQTKPTPAASSRELRRVPSIHGLQVLIKNAWDAGYCQWGRELYHEASIGGTTRDGASNERNSAVTDIVGSDSWIGTPEVRSIFFCTCPPGCKPGGYQD